MHKLTIGLVLASTSLATADAAEKERPRVIAAHQALPTELQHLPRIIIGEPHTPAPVVVQPFEKVRIATPKVGPVPAMTVDAVAGQHVHTATGAIGLVPSADAKVEPGRLVLKTGANVLLPATETRIERLFEVKLNVGDTAWHIRPFDIRRVK
jgi:hypothetical protein